MIEIKIVKDVLGLENPALFEDGVPRRENVFVKYFPKLEAEEPSYEVTVFDDSLMTRLLAMRLSSIPNNIALLELFPQLNLIQDEPEILHEVTVYRDGSGQVYAVILFQYDTDNWKRLWSITEHRDEFKRTVQKQTSLGISLTPASIMEEVLDIGAEEISLYFPVEDINATIEEEARKHSGIIGRIHELTEISLNEMLLGESVVLQFDFPEEVKIPCEQYLIYFVQFLKDLGVEATAELQHEAGQVLFAVTPTDQDTALDKIRAALEIYLRLSASPINDSSALNNEIAVQRLIGEIQSLQSRLTLARAEIQFKDKTIEAQQFIIDRQRLSGDVMLESLKNVTPQPPKEDKEELLGGIVEITKYEGKGVNVNFAEVFRRLKEYLAKKAKG